MERTQEDCQERPNASLPKCQIGKIAGIARTDDLAFRLPDSDNFSGLPGPCTSGCDAEHCDRAKN